MKKIAIFVSGAGESAERIVKLFNEGNRVRTELVIVDDSATSLLERLKDEDVTLVHIPDDEWHTRTAEIVGLLKNNDIRLIVLDNFAMSLQDEILEATEGEMVRVSSPELAPREVVGALEADLRKPVEEKQPEPKAEEEKIPSLESEWADTLKIQYRPPKIPTTPPEIPNPESPSPDKSRYLYTPQPDRRSSQQELKEPMPSTWLIGSVLVTVFCCFIPGIIAIIFSSQVSSKYYSGDIEGSRRASRQAEIWIILSVVLGVLAATLYIPFMMIGW